MRRFSTVVILGLSAAIFLFTVAGPHGYIQLLKIDREIDFLQQKNHELEKSIISISNRIYGLKTNDFVLEKHARENLGLSKPNDIVYIFPAHGAGQ